MCPPFRIYMYSFVLIRIFFIEIAYLDPEDERLLEEDLNTPTDSKRYERENERRERMKEVELFLLTRILNSRWIYSFLIRLILKKSFNLFFFYKVREI